LRLRFRDRYVPDTLPDARTPPDPRRLQPGRHGLSREAVARNQRERIMLAVAEAAAAGGYVAMTVEDVIGRAGVSRRTFYEHFPAGKHEAFLRAYDDAIARAMAAVRLASDAAITLRDRVADSLAAFLAFVAAEPALAEMCIVEVLAAGPEAIARRDQALARFVALIEELAGALPEEDRPPPLTARLIAGGVYEVLSSRILRGEAAAAPALLPELLYSALLPYFGYEIALEEYRRRSAPST
jgi:AcrR family transcriptional regulator